MVFVPVGVRSSSGAVFDRFRNHLRQLGNLRANCKQLVIFVNNRWHCFFYTTSVIRVVLCSYNQKSPTIFYGVLKSVSFAMHFSIPETVDLQEKDGSYYQVNCFDHPLGARNENLAKHVACKLKCLNEQFQLVLNFSDFISQGYHIHINGIHHCTLRYKQLRHMHDQLRVLFSYETLPEFPSKKLLPLSTPQVEERRLLLEKYLQSSKCCIFFLLASFKIG